MATSATVFRLLWRVGKQVRVNSTGRTGTIQAVVGPAGSNATIIVAVTGGTPTSFRTSQLTLL